MMVAPKAPEGGWKKWFLDHPYQRTKYPIQRSAIYHYGAEPPKPSDVPRFEFVEMWYESKGRRLYANLNGESPNWLRFGPNTTEAEWDDGVRDLFDHAMASEPPLPPPPPEPVGSGWDDFDWSI